MCDFGHFAFEVRPVLEEVALVELVEFVPHFVALICELLVSLLVYLRVVLCQLVQSFLLHLLR